MGDNDFIPPAAFASIRAAQVKCFKDGWKSGVQVALLAATGISVDGAAIYDGPPLPAEFHAWVDQRLSKLEAA